MSTRTRYTAEYLYPGAFFPESVSVPVKDDTLQSILDSDPGPDALYKNTPAYGVLVRRLSEKRAVFDDGTDVWVVDGTSTLTKRYLWGQFYSSDSIKAMEGESTLYRNSLHNGIVDGAIKCRSGNWQTVEPKTVVITESGRTISFD